jgi:hypothetical protein
MSYNDLIFPLQICRVLVLFARITQKVKKFKFITNERERERNKIMLSNYIDFDFKVRMLKIKQIKPFHFQFCSFFCVLYYNDCRSWWHEISTKMIHKQHTKTRYLKCLRYKKKNKSQVTSISL